MIKGILMLISFGLILNANSQDNKASKLLANYGFTTENVLASLDASKASYSYKAESLTTTVQSTNNNTAKIEKVYTYDSQKKDGEKFTLISVNNNEPNKKDYKHFDKEKNTIVTDQSLSLKEQDFFIKSDDE
jgi:alpha-D-ribose 1-methylphosphonate 5-triphosphate diphosphatase PhnM